MSKLLNTSPTSIPSLTALCRWTPNHRMIHRLTVACIWAYTTNGANCWWGSCVVDHVFTPSTNGKSKRKIKNCNHIVSEWRYGKLFAEFVLSVEKSSPAMLRTEFYSVSTIISAKITPSGKIFILNASCALGILWCIFGLTFYVQK